MRLCRDAVAKDESSANLAGLAMVLSRPSRRFRARERQQLLALARIADRRWLELSARAARAVHPSAV